MTNEELEKKRAEQRHRKETICKYFNGAFHNKECKAGVLYREMVGGEDYGWMARTPCIPDSPLNKEPLGKCDKYVKKSPAELMAEELETMAFSNAVVMALALIKQQEADTGTVPCPKCDAGKIHYSRAKLNGHVWGKCETKGCLTWMQ